MAIKQPYLVLKQEDQHSKVYGTPMTKITLLGIKDREEYITYIDSPNKNHSHWTHITNNPGHGFILGNLKVSTRKTKSGRPLINADSQPIIQWEEETDEEMLKQIADIWAEEDQKNNSDRFRDLFN
jgi:hypothetical protein